MFITLFDGPKAGTNAPDSLFAEGEGLIVVTTLVPQPGGDVAVTRRLAVYRTVAPDEAVFAGWDDEIDRGDDEIATELWASDSDEIAASAACDDTMDGTEIVLHLVRREWARV